MTDSVQSEVRGVGPMTHGGAEVICVQGMREQWKLLPRECI